MQTVFDTAPLPQRCSLSAELNSSQDTDSHNSQKQKNAITG